MNEREFEEFVLMQMKRSANIHGVNVWLYRALIAAGIIMFIVSLIMEIPVSRGLGVVPLLVGFFLMERLSRGAAHGYKYAAEDMEFVLSDPASRLPEDYSEATKKLRRKACETLASTRGLIISYGIIALTCWAATALFLGIAVLDEFESIMFIILGMVTAAMAVILTVLTGKSVRDLPMARRYREHLKENAK